MGSVKVSEVEIKIRPMTLAEVKKGSENVKEAVKTLEETGPKSYLNFKNLKKSLDIIGAVGDIVGGIQKFQPDPENPLLQSLQTLEDRVQQLEKNMTASFNEMKSFISKIKFYVKVVTPTSVLTKAMRDCLTNPGQEAVENFKRFHEDFSPIGLIYTILSYLEQGAGNPIRVALEANNQETFEKWEELIGRILKHLMVLEAFYTGICGSDSLQVIEAASEVFGTLYALKKELRLDESWYEISRYLEDFVDTHKHLSHGQKADDLKTKLESYGTSDAYYIIVSDESPDKDHLVINEYSKDQVIQQNRDGICIIIYRSLLANSANLEDIEQMKRDVREYKKDHSDPSKLKFNNAGFSMLIGGLNEQIRSANCPRREYGPGWWTIDWDFGGSIKQKLIAGFK
uniref:Dot/Icm secretion system substrate n=1 Tax=Caenorhabditis tropicalis TaxID=1561998 RepID=A0A1I7TVT1_9PELO